MKYQLRLHFLYGFDPPAYFAFFSLAKATSFNQLPDTFIYKCAWVHSTMYLSILMRETNIPQESEERNQGSG